MVFLLIKLSNCTRGNREKVNLESIRNKTGLQPVSRPVEPILGFFQKGFNAKNGAKMCSKNV